MTPKDFENKHQVYADSLTDSAAAEAMLKCANDNFTDDSSEKRFEVAYKYFAVAEYAEKNDVAVSGSDAGHLFHFAGHHFRFVESWNKAAEAYEAAGNSSVKKKDARSLEWAIRSYARAKVCFQDIGDSEKADSAYLKEQETKRKKYRIEKKYMSAFWYSLRKLTTNYGESATRWFISFLAVVVFFAVLYCLTKEWTGKESGFAHIADNMYLYFVTALGFGEVIRDIPWEGKLLFTLNLVSGYTMLALGIDIIIRKFRQS